MKTISRNNKGFTLIELLIAVTVSAVVMGAIYKVYNHQQNAHDAQQQVVEIQQNLRAAMAIMEKDIRQAGLDPDRQDEFGMTAVGLWDVDGNPDPTADSAIQFTSDMDGSGGVDAGETITYSIYDSPVATPDGVLDLARNINDGAGRILLVEGIQAMGFAYAFDADEDGILDTSAGGNVVWAIDADNDGRLETDLDTDGNGIIDAADDTDANGFLDGVALPGGIAVDPGRVKAVRIWLLGRARTPTRNYTDPRTYVVGNRVITPNDTVQRRLLTASVKCRNNWP